MKKEGGIHIITEEFIGVNSFVVAKQGLWGFMLPALLKRGNVCVVPCQVTIFMAPERGRC